MVNKFGKDQKLLGFEIPKGIYLEKESMIVLGCIAKTTLKMQRNKGYEIFKK